MLGDCRVPSNLSSGTLRTCHPLQEHGKCQGELGGGVGNAAFPSKVLLSRNAANLSVSLGYVSFILILSLFFWWFCCSTSVHRPKSFIPDEFAVVTMVKNFFSSHLAYPKRAVYPNRSPVFISAT